MGRDRHRSWSWGQTVRMKVPFLWAYTAFGETVQQPLHCYHMGSGRKHTDNIIKQKYQIVLVPGISLPETKRFPWPTAIHISTAASSPRKEFAIHIG